jgi:hypothetical protein
MCTNLNLTDMETCYKLFHTATLQGLPLREKRFGFEPEVTAKIARVPNIRIYEVGISYYGRTYAEGKKINWKDGFRAIYCIAKYGFLRIHYRRAEKRPVSPDSSPNAGRPHACGGGGKSSFSGAGPGDEYCGVF